jgi:hypothetical protein
MTTRKELVEALRVRYSGAAFGDRIKILDEFVALTGYHRKHAIRVLGEEIAAAKMVRTRNRLYDEAVRQSLTVLWEAADRICGKRMKALIPMLVDAMERHGHLDLDAVVKTKVLQVSAATIDRVLEAARLHIDGQRKRRNGVGSAIRRSIPVRTFADWRDPPPGFFEIDMVEHCGGVKTEGEFVHTLTGKGRTLPSSACSLLQWVTLCISARSVPQDRAATQARYIASVRANEVALRRGLPHTRVWG